jgi:hypothetical protein
VPELIDLVGADRLNRQMPLGVGDVGRAGCHGADAGPGERDLRGRREHERPIGMARLARRREDVEQRLRLRVEIVNGVGVVPEQAEVGRGRLHARQAFDHTPAVGHAGGVAVLRHAPHAEDGGVRPHQLLHLIHVGPIRAELDRQHLDPEMLADGEMTIVARARAKKLHARRAPPGARATRHAVRQRAHHRVMHHLQAAVAADDDLSGGRLEQR